MGIPFLLSIRRVTGKVSRNRLNMPLNRPYSMGMCGKRLKHVKENDLVHGEFGKWLESVDMKSQQASMFIKVYEEIPKNNNSHMQNISFRALYQIATR